MEPMTQSLLLRREHAGVVLRQLHQRDDSLASEDTSVIEVIRGRLLTHIDSLPHAPPDIQSKNVTAGKTTEAMKA